jgi:uncharacterized membrane protein
MPASCNKTPLKNVSSHQKQLMNKGVQKLVWAALLTLAFIGVVIVMRRVTFLIPVIENRYVPSPPAPGMPQFPEEGFVQNPRLTMVHILPGLLFIGLGLTQFIRRIRQKRPAFHRWSGRIALMSGLIIGLTGILMGFKMSISGISETAATTFFGIFFLFSLLRALYHIRRRNISSHREWTIRAFAIGIAVTTARPIVGVFFATSSITGLTPQEFFGAALWISFTIHLIAAEVWINHTRASYAKHIAQV